MAKVNLKNERKPPNYAAFYFQTLVNDILGDNYANEAMDETSWYCLTCRDILRKYHELKSDSFHYRCRLESFMKDHCPIQFVVVLCFVKKGGR